MSPLIVSRLPGFPSITTIYTWRREYSEFNDAVELALGIAGDTLAMEALEIADENIATWDAELSLGAPVPEEVELWFWRQGLK